MIIQNNVKNISLIVVSIVTSITILSWILLPSVPDFSIPETGADRKEAFFNYFLPLVQQRNKELLAIRQKITRWQNNTNNISWWDKRKLHGLAKDYQLGSFDINSANDWATLLRRVDTIPPSLALAQAANESAWGTSRFALEGYNYYGQWCFEVACGMVPDNRDAQKSHEVAVFSSPAESVESYIHNLNSHDAYKELRGLREGLRKTQKPISGIALAAGLEKYSERGPAYIEELREIINHNKLDTYDNP